MIPYQGRATIRVARVVLAFSCLAWYPFTGARISSSLAFLIAYAIFSVGALFETKFVIPNCKATPNIFFNMLLLELTMNFWVR